MKLSKYHLSALMTMGIYALAIFLFGQPAHAACNECGTVADVKTVKIEGKGSGAGAIAGGVLGGVLGHQVGAGRGKDVATVGGAAGGAYVGHQMEKKSNEKTEYRVIVTMENGASKTFKFAAQTNYQVGDRIKVLNGKLARQ
jgi:outer membrane lipoprotein SlyB